MRRTASLLRWWGVSPGVKTFTSVILSVLVVCTACSQGKGAPKYETAKVDRGSVTSKVTATGTLSALVTVQVGSQVSGRIAELNVDFNSVVKKGQVLAKIDPQVYQAALEQAQANLTVAEGNLEKAKVQLSEAERVAARQKALFEKQLIAQADAETAESNAAAARAQVTVANGSLSQARAAKRQAEVNLAYTTISSPISGLVISRAVELGQTVAASLSAPTLFVIAEDLSRMQVDTSVSEADVGRLTEGMEATFRVDAYPTERFKGRLRQVRNAATTVQNVVTYDGVLDVENPEGRLKPGMTANVTFTAAQKTDVVRVPNAALRFRVPPELLALLQSADAGVKPRAFNREGSADQRSVWRLIDGVPEQVMVRVGLTDGTVTELVDGDLHEGDLLVTDVSGLAQKTGAPSSNPFGGPGQGGGMRRGGL